MTFEGSLFGTKNLGSIRNHGIQTMARSTKKMISKDS